MTFLLSCIGRQKRGPEQDLLSLYQKRMQIPFVVKEYDTKPSLPTTQRKVYEADMLLSPFTTQDFIIALDERGKSLSSQAFASIIDRAQVDSYKTIGLVIGGADGLHTSVLERANLILSLGSMTWPHMLVRPLIAEQVYRALCILAHHPYHRE